MKIIKDKTIDKYDPYYTEYKQNQLIVKLDIGETIEIFVNGESIKQATAQFVNCHFDLIIQDKGIKKLEEI
jgi:hypothetical protein